MKVTNNLDSHHSESICHRADKMGSAWRTEKMNGKFGYSKLKWRVDPRDKHFSNRKRRMFLKNPLFFNKI